jgi:hypothetical protein
MADPIQLMVNVLGPRKVFAFVDPCVMTSDEARNVAAEFIKNAEAADRVAGIILPPVRVVPPTKTS